MESRISDLSLAFILADIADNVTLKFSSPHGVTSKTKADGTLATLADSETEDAVLKVLETTRPDNGFLGEEIGSRQADMAGDGLWMELMERMVLLPVYRIGER
jgi:fructose-1,6-bisphosphatase/inositol monophosphatase family enzyme